MGWDFKGVDPRDPDVSNLFGLEYDTYWQIMNLTRHLNTLSYTYRTKTDPLTGNQLGVERRPIPMFPLILTFGIKFEF